MLIVFILCTFITWLLTFQWRRRKLYRFASKIPGPANYPLIGSAWIFFGNSESILSKMLDILDKYPDFSKLWMGPDLYFIVGKPSYIEIILNSPSCLGKNDVYDNLRPLTGTGIFTAPVHKWKKNRKLINPAFQQKILDTFVEIFVEQSEIFMKNLEKKIGKTDIDIFSLTGALALDSICESNMGIKVGSQLQTSESRSGYSEWIDEAAEILFMKTCKIWYKLDFIFKMTKYSKILDETLFRIHQVTQKVVKQKREAFERRQQHLKNGEASEEEDVGKRKTFLELLLQQSSEGKKMTDVDLRHEVDTLTIAGSDTTATTLCFCFVMLGMHQNIQQKLRQEVIDVLGENRDVTANDLNHLDLLDRFIKETLRLFPVAPLIFRACTAEVNLGDYVIPEGCSISLGIIGVHRNEKYWEEPLKFNPDRFLPEETAKRHRYCYLPFAGGPRNCIDSVCPRLSGKLNQKCLQVLWVVRLAFKKQAYQAAGIFIKCAKYATMLLKTIVAMVIRKYVIKTQYKSIEDIKLKADFVLKPVNGFKISVQLRQ